MRPGPSTLGYNPPEHGREATLPGDLVGERVGSRLRRGTGGDELSKRTSKGEKRELLDWQGANAITPDPCFSDFLLPGLVAGSVPSVT